VICRNRLDLLVSAEELGAEFDSDDLRIIDCRFHLGNTDAGREQFLASHIPGAVYAHLDHDLSAPVSASTGRHPLPDIDTATDTFQRLGIDPDSRVVVYDSVGGAMAARAWWMLRWLGHDSVRLLDGGFPAWLAAGYAVESGPAAEQTGNFMASPAEGVVVTTADLVEALQAGDWPLLVDARDAARYRGETEPIDPVAGHIPGCRNLPVTDTLDESGTFRSIRALRSIWLDVLGEERDTRWSAMCGSGVTACHLAISAQLAGYREPSIYIGSWSEWIRDPARPVATGTPP
jgi:thiosulfate/3-mercaptopyruvate sulfurtransferase